MSKILCTLLMLPFYVFGQDGYWPDGKKIEETFSINQIIQKYYPESKHSSFQNMSDNKINSQLTGIDMIYYELLTGKPLMILASKKPNINDINKITSEYKNNYYKSLYFIDDIKNLIKKNSADTAYITKTLGKPVKEKNTWYYPQHKLRFIVNEGFATSFASENYFYNLRATQDEFTKDKTFRTPVFEKYVLAKYIEKGVSTYFCEIYAQDEVPDDETDASLYFLFRDGTSLKLPADAIMPGPKSYGRIFIQSRYMTVFTTKMLKAIRIGTSSIVPFTTQESKDFQGYMKVLHTKK